MMCTYIRSVFNGTLLEVAGVDICWKGTAVPHLIRDARGAGTFGAARVFGGWCITPSGFSARWRADLTCET